MSENSVQNSGQPGVVVPDHVSQLLHECEKICGEFQELSGLEASAANIRAEELRAAYRAIALPPEYAEIMDKTFADADRKFQEDLAAAVGKRERRGELLETINDLWIENARLSTQVKLLPLRREFEKIRKSWNAAIADLDDVDVMKERFAESCARIDARLAQEKTAAEAALVSFDMLIAELEALTASGEPEKFKERRDALEKSRADTVADLDTETEAARTRMAKYAELIKDLNAKLASYYQAQDLARWESYTLKLDLCKELETLKDVPDNGIPAAAGRLREIRKRWQDLGAVPREKQHELGPRYYEYTTQLQHRVDEFYKKQRAAHAAAAEIKTKLCESAEAVADSTEWNATGDKLKALQQEWKAAGHAGREADTALYTRFRAACDKFFNARNAYWEVRQKEQAQGAARKNELCEAAAKLKDMPGAEAVREAKRLRSEYQAAPRAGKAEPELNARFNKIMDEFFGVRRAAIDQSRTRREEIVAAIDALEVTDIAAAEKTLSALHNEWRALPPAPRESAASLEAKVKTAAGKVEKKISELRRKQQQERGAMLPGAMREVASLLAAARENVALPEVGMDLSPFPKLAALATDLVAGGLTPEMEKSIARNTHEFSAALEQLESSQESAAPANDLAAELAAAIAGNFGASVFKESKGPDSRELQKKLLNSGMIEPAELETLLARYEKVAASK